MVIILIPGMHPAAAKGAFNAIKKTLPGERFIELSSASESELMKRRPHESFIVVGKSAGGRIALEHQIKYKDAAALVLLAPAVSAETRYAEIKVPTLIVHGTADEVVSFENSAQLVKLIKGSELVQIKGANHSYTGKENEVGKAVAKFLRQKKLIG